MSEHFKALNDPRVKRKPDHLLIDIVAIAILAVLSGANDMVAIETYGKAKQDWLKTFLELPNGIPSHDTFSRVLALLDPKQASEHHLVLAQQRVESKSNEITAIPELLNLLDIKGAIITLDAMGTQRNIAAQIIDQGGDYILALKENQGTLHNQVKAFFTAAQQSQWEGMDVSHNELRGLFLYHQFSC